MTTLHVPRPTNRRIRDVGVWAGFAAWLGSLFAMFAGYLKVPAGSTVPNLMLFGIPVAFGLYALLRRSEVGAFPLMAGIAVALMVAWLSPLWITQNPKLAYAVPLAVIGGFIAQRWPAATFATIFVLSGTYGSITAFTGIHADSVADKVIDAAWAGLIGRLLLGRQLLRVRPTPAFFMLLAFVVISFIAALTTTPMSAGIQAFRFAPLYISVVLLLGYGSFDDRALERLTQAMVIACSLIAGYAALRWAIGPSGKESALQSSAFAKQYNQLAYTGDIKLQGSLPEGNSLGLWTACTIPFLIAMTISLRGWIRIVAAGSLPLAVIALFGSQNRAALAAVIVGALLIVVIHVLSRGFRGPRLGIATLAALVLIGSGAFLYPALINNPEKQKRYSNLLTPSQDQPFQERLNKWRSVFDDVSHHPFGHGLGAGNPSAIFHRFEDIGYYVIDNSYLMVAYDQGLLVLAFMVLTFLVLLVELLSYAIWTRGPTRSALCTAAVGTLVAMLVVFTAANSIVYPVIVTGWLIVGLGVAQFGSLRSERDLRRSRAPSILDGVGGMPDGEVPAYPVGAGSA